MPFGIFHRRFSTSCNFSSHRELFLTFGDEVIFFASSFNMFWPVYNINPCIRVYVFLVKSSDVCVCVQDVEWFAQSHETIKIDRIESIWMSYTHTHIFIWLNFQLNFTTQCGMLVNLMCKAILSSLMYASNKESDDKTRIDTRYWMWCALLCSAMCSSIYLLWSLQIRLPSVWHF